jgi:galactokinase/galacturonokinase
MTLDRSILMAAVPLEESVLEIESLEFPGPVEVELTARPPRGTGGWADYVRAAVGVLAADQPITRGLRAVISGDLPGSGLSSSAAVLIAYLFGLAEVNGLDLKSEDTVSLVQRAENSYIGLASGRLDQSVILHASEEHLVHIDCSDFTIEHVPRPTRAPPFRILVAFSGTLRSLVTTGFNVRVEECREAARRLLELADRRPAEAPVLSDVEPRVFEAEGHHLPGPLNRRAAHYFGETARVGEGVAAWRNGDLLRFGELMTASGESSIVNYECGTPPLVTLYELLREAPGVYGTRFSGAGFGGSCIAIADPAACDEAVRMVARGYSQAHPQHAGDSSFHICSSDGSARLFRPEG